MGGGGRRKIEYHPLLSGDSKKKKKEEKKMLVQVTNKFITVRHSHKKHETVISALTGSCKLLGCRLYRTSSQI